MESSRSLCFEISYERVRLRQHCFDAYCTESSVYFCLSSNITLNVNMLSLLKNLVIGQWTDHPVASLVLVSLASILVYLLFNEILRYQARLAGFEGPTGYPLIGNLWDIRTNAAEQYRQWSRKYGSVYQIQLGNIPVVVVNSAVAARTIFGQNAQALSSRPELYTFHKVTHFLFCVALFLSLFRLFAALPARPLARPLSVSH